MRSDTHVFAESYAAVNEVDLRVDGRMMAVDLVSASFVFRGLEVSAPDFWAPLARLADFVPED